MSPRNENRSDWWKDELLLIYETTPETMPGYAFESRWQEKAEPAFLIDVIAASNALQTHAKCFMNGHITDRICYFKSGKFKENGRDFLADYLKASKKTGFRTIVYFNVHAIKPEFGSDFPEWAQVYDDGTPKQDQYGVEHTMCVNSGFRDWVRDVCLDLCKYPIDGIFFDGPVMFARCCYCENCRRLYREKYGAELPPKEPGHPELKRLADFQAESMLAFYEHSRQAIRSVREDVAFYGNSGTRNEPYYSNARNNRIIAKGQDVLAAEAGFEYGMLSQSPIWKVSSNVKYYQTQSGGKPTLGFVSPAHGPWRMYYRGEPEIRSNLAQAVLNGSGVWLSSVRWFHETSAFKRIASDYRWYAKNSRYYVKTRSKARVAVVWGEDSVNFYSKPTVMEGDFSGKGQKGDPVGHIAYEFNGIYDALVRNRVACDVIDEESVRSEEIGRYDLLILPNVACTGRRFDDRLREYVKQGGNVLATFETSICSETGKRVGDLSLGDLFGITILRTPVMPFMHFYLMRENGDSEVFEEIEPHLLPAPHASCEAALKGAEMLSPYSIKVKGWDGSPILASKHPALTVNRYGKGKAVYMAGTFGCHYWQYKQKDIRLLFRNLVSMLSASSVEVSGGAGTVEVVHREANDSSFETVSLLNYTGNQSRPMEEITDLEQLTVRMRTSRKRARSLCSGRDLSVERADGEIHMSLPRLGAYETILIE